MRCKPVLADTVLTNGDVLRLLVEANITLSNGDTFDPKTYATGALIIDFWASWCGPCLGELPSLKAVQAHFGKTNLNVLLVSESDDWSAAQNYAASNNISLALARFDPSQMPVNDLGALRQGTVMNGGVKVAFPLAYIISKSREITEGVNFPWDWDSPQVRAVLTEFIGS